MNIISNNCLGAFIYKFILKIEYKNPFIWTSLNDDDFLKLVNNYDKYDYKNITLVQSETKCNCYDIKLSDLTINNIHMIYNSNYKSPTKDKNGNVYYCNIKQFIYDNWMKRTKRMLDEKAEPIIVVDNIKKCDKLIYICKKKKYKLWLFSNKLHECNTNDLVIKNFNVEKYTSPSQLLIGNETNMKKFLHIS